MITIEEFDAIMRETDCEKREAMVDALSEEDAKYIVKSYVNFLRRNDSI